MRQFLLIITFLYFAGNRHLYAQDSTASWGIAFGANQFPTAYFPKSEYSDCWNCVSFGYHLGFVHERNKIVYRGGINGNQWATDSHRAYSLGFELGAEYKVLREHAKWIFDAGLMFFAGEMRTYERFDGYGPSVFTHREWNLGPVLLFGRHLNDHWKLFSEVSVSLGTYEQFTSAGFVFKTGPYGIFTRRMFGVGVRYKF